jgi:Tfp pilus assembly protein PilP
MSNETDTPQETLAAATIEEVLPIHRMTLLGTFDKGDTLSALIRTPDGDIHMLRPGDTLGQATVTAIEMGVLRLSVGAHSTKLTMPNEAGTVAAPKG